MIIRIKNIEFEHENESVEPTGAKVDYQLMLNDSHLEGTIEIKENDLRNPLANAQMWEFSAHIQQKIMASI